MSAVEGVAAESVEDRVGSGGVVLVLPCGYQQGVAAFMLREDLGMMEACGGPQLG